MLYLPSKLSVQWVSWFHQKHLPDCRAASIHIRKPTRKLCLLPFLATARNLHGHLGQQGHLNTQQWTLPTFIFFSQSLTPRNVGLSSPKGFNTSSTLISPWWFSISTTDLSHKHLASATSALASVTLQPLLLQASLYNYKSCLFIVGLHTSQRSHLLENTAG